MTIPERLNRITFVDIRPDISGLTPPEQLALRECIEAAHFMDRVFAAQVYGQDAGLDAWQLKQHPEKAALQRYYKINYGPWDRFCDDAPFLPGVGPKPKTAELYPQNLTLEEWQTWLETHPADKEKLESPYTVIRRASGDRNKLLAVPYSVYWHTPLQAAARHLQNAAVYLPHASPLRTFLGLQAAAFLTNQYRPADIAWVKTDGLPFEITIGAHEVYEDGLLGLKAAYTAFIGIPDQEATAHLQRFAAFLPEYDRMLAQKISYKPRGALTPMVAVNDVFRAGDGHCGRQFVAFNLPNDRTIHEEVGSKKVFSISMMRAKFETLSLPIAAMILQPSDLVLCSFNSRLLFVLGHELAHGMGPNDRQLRDLHSTFEEAKADCLGMAFLGYLRDRGEITAAELRGALTSTLVASFVGWRIGFTESHGAGELMEYNWLKAAGALEYDAVAKRCRIDLAKALPAYEALGYKFMELQKADDYDRAKTFRDEWSHVPPEIPEILTSLHDIPVEVYPIFHVKF